MTTPRSGPFHSFLIYFDPLPLEKKTEYKFPVPPLPFQLSSSVAPFSFFFFSTFCQHVTHSGKCLPKGRALLKRMVRTPLIICLIAENANNIPKRPRKDPNASYLLGEWKKLYDLKTESFLFLLTFTNCVALSPKTKAKCWKSLKSEFPKWISGMDVSTQTR